MRDADVRKAVINTLEIAHAGDSNTRIVQEMGVWSGSVRIDIAVINGELGGWELKSDKDDLSRLPQQAEIYSRVFDRICLVAGEKHHVKAMNIVPEWWSIVVATKHGDITELQRCRTGGNPDPDPLLIAELLWKEEAIKVLDSHGLAKGWRSKRVKFLYHRLANELSLETLKEEVRFSLKARKGWLGQIASH